MLLIWSYKILEFFIPQPTDKIKPLTHAYAIEEDKDFEESVKNEVQRLWRDVEKQCQDSNSELQPLTEDTKTDIDWNIIRVFVSSTFTDFFNEREVLVKKVKWQHNQ